MINFKLDNFSGDWVYYCVVSEVICFLVCESGWVIDVI